MINALEQILVLHNHSSKPDDEALFWMSNFVAKRYSKTAALYRRSKTKVPQPLSYYRQAFEACSLLDFPRLLRKYFFKGKFIMWIKLFLAMRGTHAK